MVEVGDRVVLFSSKDKHFIGESATPEVGEVGMVINAPSFKCFLPKTSVEVGDACRIFNTKDKYFARGETSICRKIIINGDFETGSLDPWVVSNWKTSISITGNSHTGNYAVMMQTYDGPPSWGRIEQQINKAASGCTLHCFRGGYGNDPYGTGYGAKCILSSPEGSEEFSLPIQFGWHESVIDWPDSLTGQPITVAFYAWAGWYANITFFFDDIILK